MADPRDRAYAELIVDDCLEVEPGWQVLVGGNPQARPLLEELCGAIGRRGAYALLRVSFEGFLPSRSAGSRRCRWRSSPEPAPLFSTRAPRRPTRSSSSQAPDNTRAAAAIETERIGHPAGRLPARHRPDDESRRALGRLPVPDRRARAGGGLGSEAFAELLYGAVLRDWAAEGERMRRDLGALRRRLARSASSAPAPTCGCRSRGGR